VRVVNLVIQDAVLIDFVIKKQKYKLEETSEEITVCISRVNERSIKIEN